MICQRVWKTAKYQGKIREKTGNFEVDDKWQPCKWWEIMGLYPCILIVEHFVSTSLTVTSKIRNLRDYHYRVGNNVTPQPTGVDIASTLKYFSQTLLRWVPEYKFI